MTKLILSFLFGLTITVPAFARGPSYDPRFTWDMATREFANGTVPTAPEMSGDWLYIGLAYGPAWGPASGPYSFFHPDGKILTNDGGLMQSKKRFSPLPDYPPGTARYQVEQVTVDLDNGGTEKIIDTFKAQATNVGVRYQVSKFRSYSGGSECESFDVCRKGQAPNSLICGNYVTADGDCRRLYGRNPIRYHYYTR